MCLLDINVLIALIHTLPKVPAGSSSGPLMLGIFGSGLITLDKIFIILRLVPRQVFCIVHGVHSCSGDGSTHRIQVWMFKKV